MAEGVFVKIFLFFSIFGLFYQTVDGDKCIPAGCECTGYGFYVKCVNGYPDFLPMDVKRVVREMDIDDMDVTRLDDVDFTEFLSLKKLILSINNDQICDLILIYKQSYDFNIVNKFDKLCADEDHEDDDKDNGMNITMSDLIELVFLFVFLCFGGYVSILLVRKFG